MDFLQFESFTAWVTMGDRAREVYAVETQHGNTITCWIASEPGKKFALNWRNATRAFPLQGTVIIDGIACDNHIMLDQNSFPDRPNAVGVSYARTSDFTRRDFMFTTISVTDDDAYLDTVGQTYNFGTITLELWAFHPENVVSQPVVHQPGRPVLEGLVVHEKSKKAGTHHVKYGEEYYAPAPVVDVVSGHKLGIAPYVTFTFRYRPMALLMANGIIPRPVALNEISPLASADQATSAEIRRLEAKLRALRSKVDFKQPGARAYQQATSKKIKPEPDAFDSYIGRPQPEVIDLTGILD
ncbi:hypothetical protein Hypma_010725 [Hypsizygus marmoreus]|uniref:DUF7918 domain-containing protein n=1 Tax=Hypsizygus marmoreus TaxID=39966 RepID=A0A369JNS3_HYPMA|nr:hypothetical protein Hypma_010725 [Hypsizygus marmoreus]